MRRRARQYEPLSKPIKHAISHIGIWLSRAEALLPEASNECSALCLRAVIRLGNPSPQPCPAGAALLRAAFLRRTFRTLPSEALYRLSPKKSMLQGRQSRSQSFAL